MNGLRGKEGTERNNAKRERETFIVGCENIILLEGSQAPPTRPSKKGNVKVNVLSWLEAVASDRGRLN
jgi:hypothetical protein